MIFLNYNVGQKMFDSSWGKVWLGLSLILTVGCDQSYEASKQQRMQIASTGKHKKQPIVIGVPWTAYEKGSFIDGVKLAVEEVNKKGGVLDGVPLEIVVNDSESDFFKRGLSEGVRRDVILNIARSYAKNPNLIAVLGHSSSETSVMASVVYQNSGIIFLAPNARYGKLTGHNFTYTFRTSLNNGIMGTQLADYAAQKGYKRIAVLSSRTESTTEFVNEFTTYAIEKHHIDIAYRRSFFEDAIDVISMVADLKSVQNVDAICIATGGKKAAEIYEQIRSAGIKVPIIGNATLDTIEFLNRVKEWEHSPRIQKSNIPTLFNDTTSMGVAFSKRFTQKYKQEGDYLAALGYDSVNLLAHAIQSTKSRIPLEIATTLRYMEACKGVSGKYEFDLNGDLKSKPLSFYHLEKNEYVFEQVKNAGVINDPKMEVCSEVDRDGDGVPTASDTCPDSTALEISKGVDKEGAERGCPIDSDSDEIPDYKDICPNDSAVAISKGVDAKGCPVDFDKDGIPDYKDDDVDGDKVANKNDHCPKTTTKELKYGVNLTGNKSGCPVDTDSDGVSDYLESCRANIKEEITQGVDSKGCPVDKDFDAVLDYQDKCLNTPEDLLVNNEGCELLALTTSLKAGKLLFATKQFTLTAAGEKSLNELFPVDKNLNLLKKIQIIAYTKSQEKELFENRLKSIAAFLQQKKIPATKFETFVLEPVAKKNNALEFIFSEVKLKPVETEAPVEPESDTDKTKTPTRPETIKDESDTRPKAGALQVQSTKGATPKAQPSVAEPRSSH